MTRDQALALVHEYTQSEPLRRHMYAVELSMRALAERVWRERRTTGASWASCTTSTTSAFPTRSTPLPMSILQKVCASSRLTDCPDTMQRAILGHATYTGVPRDTLMARALFAADELSGFLVACAMVRPNRSLADLEAPSVQEEAQGQGVCPRREPGGRAPRRGGTGRAARRADRDAHRARCGRTSGCSASAPPDRRHPRERRGPGRDRGPAQRLRRLVRNRDAGDGELARQAAAGDQEAYRRPGRAPWRDRPAGGSLDSPRRA